MEKEVSGTIQPIKKKKNNPTLFIIIGVLLLLIFCALIYLGYDYFSQKIEPNQTGQNFSYVNETTLLTILKLMRLQCQLPLRRWKMQWDRNLCQLPKDCERPDSGGGGGGGGSPAPPCTPNCAGKQCGDDGCGGSCGHANLATNATLLLTAP